MARLSALIALLFLSSAAVAGEGVADSATPKAGATKSFAGWTGSCDNLGDCVAIGTTERDLFYVRIARAAGPAGDAQVKIIFVPTAMLAGNAPAFRLKAVSKRSAATFGPFPTGPRDMNGAYFAALARGSASRAFVEAIRSADTLDYALLSATGTLELDGLSDVLRWIDERQGRTGTTTALVAPGTAPADRVPPRVAPRAVRAAKAGSVAAIAEPAVNAAILSRASAMADCQKDVVEAHAGYRAWRLGVDTVLVEVPCLRAAYNASSALFFTDAQGGSIRPATLPQADANDAGTPANIVVNLAFDAATMALSEFGKARGLGDCGETRTWLWTGETFALLKATRLDACPGALPEDWPAVFTAVAADPPAPQPATKPATKPR